MADVVFAVPGDLKSATGGYAYDRRVIDLLPDFGVHVSVMTLPDAFPSPSAADLAETGRLLKTKPHDAVLMVDGLAFGAFTDDILDTLEGRVVALVHHPLFLETGLPHGRKVEIKASEENALQSASHIVVTSRVTKRILVDTMGLSADKVTIAEPGTDPAQRATGTGAPLQILSVGAVLPRKGYHLLVEALAPLKHIDWRLTIAGALDRHPEAVATVQKAIQATGLEDRVTLAGKVVPATLERYYESADLFVSASLFEGYGMVLAEAMARGLPMVIAAGGAAAETAGEAAALHVEAGNATALTTAIERALTDKKLRDRLADAAWEAGRTLPTWHETARRIAAVILGLRP
ncbi:group 1 glycosyl transferase [Hyphomicrobium denitrificans 1NES1]|uniref:Group 1 glycosyl transferase n=1 Tax=Hyphomicrobium denitrificans 1NES1 TaxID=670307 RepID=N0B4U3_9HYPH|nr:glycosyltransferase family 4 protein [Hyphomicrobium denitrificans]AGK57998.1 group 1 glycosyl transferase [Hyphomicrobium denitrificans 1NES1]